MTLDVIILAVIAGFLAYRLYLVLGERHDASDPDNRPDPFAPVNHFVQDSKLDKADAAKPVDAIILADAEAGHPMSLDAGLKAIAAADAAFDEKSFVRGATAAFEMIVKAYAAGDLATLKPLLSDDLYHAFADDIRARNQRGEKLETVVHKIKSADIASARVDRTISYISVHFVSEQSSVTKNANGDLVTGDLSSMQEVLDEWTFARNLRSEDPNWQLVEA